MKDALFLFYTLTRSSSAAFVLSSPNTPGAAFCPKRISRISDVLSFRFKSILLYASVYQFHPFPASKRIDKLTL